MDILVTEEELYQLAFKAARYDLMIDSLILEKFNKIDLFSDWESTEAIMSDLKTKSENKFKFNVESNWQKSHSDKSNGKNDKLPKQPQDEDFFTINKDDIFPLKPHGFVPKEHHNTIKD
mgnify:CR=1 FL=1